MRLAPVGLALMLACGASNGEAPATPAGEKSGLDTPWPNWQPVGSKARPFRALNVSGGPALELVPNKVNILVFWATWSEPDKKGLFALEKVWQRLKPLGVVVRALSVDDDQRGVGQFAKSNALTFDIGWDEAHRIADLYHPTTDPTFLVIDQTGVIRFAHLGYHEGEMNEMEKEIASLVGGAPAPPPTARP